GGDFFEVPNLNVAPGDKTVVEATPAGVTANIVWDTVAAFGPRNLTARLKLTAEDGFGLPGVPATATATIENDKAPTVRFLSPIGFPAKPIAGRIPFTVAVTDPEVALDPLGNGRADLFVEFSTDGGTSFKAASILTIGSGARDA